MSWLHNFISTSFRLLLFGGGRRSVTSYIDQVITKQIPLICCVPRFKHVPKSLNSNNNRLRHWARHGLYPKIDRERNAWLELKDLCGFGALFLALYFKFPPPPHREGYSSELMVGVCLPVLKFLAYFRPDFRPNIPFPTPVFMTGL